MVYGGSSSGVGDAHLTTPVWVSTAITAVDIDSLVLVVDTWGPTGRTLRTLVSFLVRKARACGKITATSARE